MSIHFVRFLVLFLLQSISGFKFASGDFEIGIIVLYCFLPEISFGLLSSLGEHIVYRFITVVYPFLPDYQQTEGRFSFIIRHAPEDFYLHLLPGLFLLPLLLLSWFPFILSRPLLIQFCCSTYGRLFVNSYRLQTIDRMSLCKCLYVFFKQPDDTEVDKLKDETYR